MILHLPHFVSPDLCQRFIALAADSFTLAGVLSAESLSKVQKSIDLVEQYGADKTWLNGDKVYFWPSHENYSEVEALVKPLLSELVSKYCETYGYQMPPWAIDYYSIIRYQEGGFFRPHQDTIWQPNGQQRTVTVIVYLNDGYEGGALHFVDRDEFVEPKTGDVVIFPCGEDYQHVSTTIRSGTKYALTLWPLVDREQERDETYVNREKLTKGGK